MRRILAALGRLLQRIGCCIDDWGVDLESSQNWVRIPAEEKRRIREMCERYARRYDHPEQGGADDARTADETEAAGHGGGAAR